MEEEKSSTAHLLYTRKRKEKTISGVFFCIA
jgi:hypothetical protein